MAKSRSGANLPVLRVQGSPTEVGRAIGETFRARLAEVVESTREMIGTLTGVEALIRDKLGARMASARRYVPELHAQLAATAEAAGVSFELLAYLNAGGYRPEVPVGGTGGCTSIVSRGADGVVVGHNEDAEPSGLEDLYLIDATVQASGGRRSRFIGLNYVQTLPGVSATLNEHGLIVLSDALDDFEPGDGVPTDFLARALLEQETIDEAVAFLRGVPRGGACNLLLVQGRRIVNLEVASERLEVREVLEDGFAHSNHYLAPTLACLAEEPRQHSVQRLTRARELVAPALRIEQMKRILADRQGHPDSLCRDRTIGAFIGHSARREVEVCWGEPDSGTWTVHAL